MFKNRGLTILLVILVSIASLFLYGFAIETKTLSLHVSTPKISNLPADWKNVKVAYFTDTTFGKNYGIESLQKIAKMIQEENPDIIFFAGDLLDQKNDQQLLDDQISDILKTMQAPLGKFAVSSSDDVFPDQSNRANELLQKGGFTLINNTTRMLYNHSLEPLQVIGVNEAASPESIQELLQYNAQTPTLLITTTPNIYQNITTYPNISLTLGSKTYGGLMNFPWINKQLVKNKETPLYRKGYYDKNKSQQLLVSGGLGSPSYFPIRILNRPTVYILSLQNSESKIAESTNQQTANSPEQDAINKQLELEQQQEQERLEQERIEQERLEQERLEQERLDQEQQEQAPATEGE